MTTVLWVVATLAQLVVLPKLSKRFTRNYLRQAYSPHELQCLSENNTAGVITIPKMDSCFMANGFMYILVFIGICKTLGTTAAYGFEVVIVFVIYYLMCKEIDAYIRENANKNAMIKL